MRTQGFSSTARSVAGIALTLVMGSTPVIAQCSMPGGGHDHASTKSHAGTTSGRPSPKKLRRSIEYVLASNDGRILLAEVLMNDREFMERFVAQLAAVPEWRALAAGQAAPARAGAQAEASRFVCPMHPEVTASAPGACPTCGMALVPRRDSGR